MFYLKAHRHKFRDKVTVDIAAVDEEIRERLKAVSSMHSSHSSTDLQKEVLQLPSSTDPEQS
jgi:hypothetical protein